MPASVAARNRAACTRLRLVTVSTAAAAVASPTSMKTRSTPVTDLPVVLVGYSPSSIFCFCALT